MGYQYAPQAPRASATSRRTPYLACSCIRARRPSARCPRSRSRPVSNSRSCASRTSTEDPIYLTAPLPSLAVGSYALLSRTLARAAIRRAFLFNAEFEDHAEHYCAELVDQHPEWEDQPVTSKLVREYGSFRSWADVFRRVGLDERDHRNASFAFAGRPELVVECAGMPAAPGPD